MKISIITASYNSAKYLDNCINSIMSQSHKDIEYIVIDGASTDKTLSLLNSRNNQITKLVSEKDNGIYDAMNKGIKHARGDVIGFLNSDDIYANNDVLKRVANIFKEDDTIEACYADLLYVDKKDTSKTIRYFKSNEFKKGLFSKGWCPPHPTFFVRKYLYECYGNFDINFRIASDVELMMRFIEKNKIKTRYIPEIWVKMRIGGVSNKSFKNIFILNREILSAFKKHGLSVNPIIFLFNKAVSRFKQFLIKPYN